MKRSVRNRLADLLLGAFEGEGNRAAVAWLARFCSLVEGQDRPHVPLGTLAEGGPTDSWGKERSEAGLSDLLGQAGLLQLRHMETGEIRHAWLPRLNETGPWLVEPIPEVSAAFPAVCDRVRVYAAILASLGDRKAGALSQDPLHRALAEAALCFNAGLFFEAHEHLEHHWMLQSPGPTKRFLQGIIQISVGFHHAHAGNYDGAVNQLAKGLEKMRELGGVVLGLDCDAFLPQVAGVRQRIVAWGRSGVRPVPLAELPRMPIRA